jgi:hypothetical protein
MSKKIIKINNIRIGLSSHANILNYSKIINSEKSNNVDYIKHINNEKIININNFDLMINGKKKSYSTYYTNPYVLDKNITQDIKIKFIYSDKIILLDKIFLHKKSLTKLDKYKIIQMIEKKFLFKNFIGIEETFVIMWYIINHDLNVIDKNIHNQMLKYHYMLYREDLFEPGDIINKIIPNNSTNLNNSTNFNNSINFNNTTNSNDSTNPEYVEKIKFYQSFYVLLESFHFTYITKWISMEWLNTTQTPILNSNYLKLNPQEILNNSNGDYYSDIKNLTEQLEIPFGHNCLFIKNCNKIFYYDPDECYSSDLYKLKLLFGWVGINFINISNREPIQTITDDGNCVFYCLRFSKFLLESKIDFNISNLRMAVVIFEKDICKKSNIYDWACDYFL